MHVKNFDNLKIVLPPNMMATIVTKVNKSPLSVLSVERNILKQVEIVSTSISI